MPIYEYQCQQCGHQLEALRKISDEPLKDCPECHKPELLKLVSAPSFRLKGVGWYETDFKSGDKKHLAESDSTSKSEATGAAAAKSDKKGAGKPDAKSSSADKKDGKSAAASKPPAAKSAGSANKKT